MRNLTMMTDLYELTMMNGYLRFGMEKNRACFDLFYRKQGDITAYAVAAGLEQMVEYVKNLHFTDEDIAYLRSLGIFDEAFLAYLTDFHFTGDIVAVPEGTVIFPGEPIVRVIAPIVEAQLLETTLLNIINHQTLIATKASRVVQAARGDLQRALLHAARAQARELALRQVGILLVEPDARAELQHRVAQELQALVVHVRLPGVGGMCHGQLQQGLVPEGVADGLFQLFKHCLSFPRPACISQGRARAHVCLRTERSLFPRCVRE